MGTMDAIKFVMLYGMEIAVVVLVGITLLAGLYQFIRDKAEHLRSRPSARS